VALIVAAMLAGCAPSAPQPADAVVADLGGLAVEGYLFPDDDATRLIARDASALAIVGVDGVALAADGSAVSPLPGGARPAVEAAHAEGVDAELLVANFDEQLGGFSADAARALLAARETRLAVAAALAERVAEGGFDGLQLDLELLDAGMRDGFTAFVDEVRAALPASATLSIAIEAAENPGGFRRLGYDLSAILPDLDRVVLMAYDQHGPWSEPGPVGASPWVETVTAAALAAGIPADRLDLGVAGYGYRWPGDGTDPSTVTVAEARELAADEAAFDAAQGEWTATLDDGTVLWWSDSRTLAVRAEFARSLGLHGLALWQLASADPLG